MGGMRSRQEAKTSARFEAQDGVKPGRAIFAISIIRESRTKRQHGVLNLNNSCPRRDFLVAWRSGKTCCSICCSENLATYSGNGLRQHYRMMHKDVDFSDVTMNEGINALRGFVASETRQNLMNLFEQRSKSVGTSFTKFRIFYCNYYDYAGRRL